MAFEMFKSFNEKKRKQFENDTGIQVPPPEELLCDQSAFEKQQEAELVEIYPGLFLEKGSLILDEDGAFVNYYDLSVGSVDERIHLDLFSFDTPIHLKRVIQNDHEINYDKSLGGNSPYGENRIARNVVYKDKEGSIHTRLFDGVPGSDVSKGITPKEVAELFEEMDVEWAYHLDGGQSAKIVTCEVADDVDQDRQIKSYGSKHYLRFPKKEGHPYLWDPDGGRKVSSGLVFKKKSEV